MEGRVLWAEEKLEGTRIVSGMARKPPAPTITTSLLAKGWSAPSGCRVRLATPADADQVRHLQHVADGQVSPDSECVEALAEGTLGGLLEPALAARQPGKALLEQVVAHASSGRWEALGAGLSFALVACDRQGRVVGALVATMPGNLLRGALDSGIDQRQALMIPVAVVKLRALAVEEDARGRGLGAALLKRAGQMTDQLGFFLSYGQVDATDVGLQAFYARCGWQVQAPGESLSLSTWLGMPLAITPLEGEVLVCRWRP